MDRNTYCGNSAGREDSSLVFRDFSSKSIKNTDYRTVSNENKRRVNDPLNIERMRALEALEKSLPILNKENSNVDILANNPPTQLDRTDYISFRRPNAINISELVTDETINLESSSLSAPAVSKDSNVSFEPSEITGRSTLYNKDINNQKKIPVKGSHINGTTQIKHLSVNDILASSFAPKARNLCEALDNGKPTFDSSIRHLQRNSSVSVSSASSSFTSFNGSKSLPRTADMSLSKNTCTEESFNGGCGVCSFSSAGAGTNIDENEEFAPSEFMRSKLINDEISWAQKYAAIPTAALSEEAKARVAQNSVKNSSAFDSSWSSTNSIIVRDPNFSVGNFFNLRSDNICNIVRSKSPNKCHTPVALVDEDDNTVTTTTKVRGSTPRISITPKIDNKTYTRVETGSIPEKNPVGNLNHEHTNIGSSTTDNSYLLNLSALDRALSNLSSQSNVSGIGGTGSELLLKQKKNSKSFIKTLTEYSNCNSNKEERDKSMGTYVKTTAIENINVEAEMMSENKENLNPNERHSSSKVALCDTLSFNESLLNSSDMKQLQRSISNSRSPLSPINITTPNILVSRVEDGEEADNDEWPDTPVIKNRRVRRTKSPQDKSPKSPNASMQDSPDMTTPVNSRLCRSYLKDKNETNKEPNTMSSTLRNEVDCNSNRNGNCGNSPNTSHGNNSASSLIMRSNTLAPHIESPRGNTSPSQLDNSPLSSPCSYNLSQLPSPTPTTLEFRSPNLDATNKSDRQVLIAGNARKILSSPAGSESSCTSSYGTLQTYRSAISGYSGRSVSRCSSSSEFSHRDGQKIPLKVTNTELSWGSIKLRSDSRKSMQIKNISNKRLVIRIEVYGPGFQIVNSQRSNTLTLQTQECRTINISFCPTVRGVAIGKLSFYAPLGATTVAQSFFDVSLNGYGGNASVVPQNITTGPVGLPFVTIGNMRELAHPLERTVGFYNKGSLLAFVAISVDSIGLMLPRLSDAFEINPLRILIPPQNVANVRITFRPKRDQIRKIIKKMENVLTLANMRIISGDEANRQRMRRLLRQMSDEERAKLLPSALDILWSEFPQEREMVDLRDIKENPNVAMDLASYFRIHDILLTINRDNMDDTFETSSLYLQDVDETVIFQNICTADSPSPSTNLETVNESIEEVDADKCSVTSTTQRTLSVSPKTIEISLNTKEPVRLSIINGYKSRQFFEAVCNVKDILCCKPSEGYVAPEGGQTDIDISLFKTVDAPLANLCVTVYMENEKIVVPVKMVE